MPLRTVVIAITALLITLGLQTAYRKQATPQDTAQQPTTTQAQASGNQSIVNFRKAKHHIRSIYADMATTFYCGCTFRDQIVNHASCGYRPLVANERAYRVEWEHIVPASDFGRAFKVWRQGDPACVDKRGRPYRGRRCARKASTQFNYMEADLYNLVPAIGEVNRQRGRLPIGAGGKDHHQLFGDCETRISTTGIEPRDSVKGFVARTYQYMDAAYPGYGILSKKNRKLFAAWDRTFPPTALEIKRARRIAAIQGNPNPFVLAAAGLASKPSQAASTNTPKQAAIDKRAQEGNTQDASP